MKFGHHGANHPVKDLDTGRVVHHQPEPRLRGRRGDAARQPARRRTCRCSTARCRASRAPTSRRSASRATRKRRPARTTSATCSTASSTLMEAAEDSNMPKRTDIKSILIIGAGPIVIGQACEFDYSGAQACKALREEGYQVILVNSQPGDDHDRPGDGRRHLHRADHLADGREDHRARSGPTRCCRRWAARPRSTARSTCARDGVLDKYDVELIGASHEGDRQGRGPREVQGGDDAHRPRLGALGHRALDGGGAATCRRTSASRRSSGPSFTLGGTGGGIAYNTEEFDDDLQARPRSCRRRTSC